MSSESPVGRLLIVGVDHRSAPAGLRDRLLQAAEDLGGRLKDIADSGVEEACLLATCDRLEVVALDGDPARAGAALEALQAAWAGLEPASFAPFVAHYREEAALGHLFGVAASLESQVLGEPQVLGQVKESHRLAAEHGACGPGLDGLMQAAYGAAKRVRSETTIAERPVSMASAALELARRLHGEASRCAALLVGLGEMSEVFADELRAAGVAELTLVHPSAGRAEAAAHRWQAHVRRWDELTAALAEAEIVVAAVGSGRRAITAEMVREALRRRRQRPIFLIDAAVPHDVEPAVQSLSGAFVYDLADLESAVEEGRQARESGVEQARAILEEELAAVLADRAARRAVPLVTALRSRFESVRREVLENGRLDAEAATRLLINRLLHDPSEALRSNAAAPPGEQARLEDSLRRLFRIGEPAAGGEPGEGAIEDPREDRERRR